MKHRNISRSLWLCISTLALSGTICAQNSAAKAPQANPSQAPNPSQRGTTGQAPVTPAQPGGARSASTPSTTSNSFISKATEINSAEIQLGQLAAKKSQNDKVKTFAQMMIKDHSDALQKFRQSNSGVSASETTGRAATSQNRSVEGTSKADGTANRNNQTTSVNAGDMPGLSPEHRQLLTRLEGLNGAPFDREYIAAMVTGHREAVRLFEQEAGQNPPNNSTDSKGQTNRSDRSDTDKTGARDTAGGTSSVSRSSEFRSLAAELLPTIRHHLQEAESLQKTIK
jgi:predicted outer membrane protein